MGISRLTALALHHNDDLLTSGFMDPDTGKFGGLITLGAVDLFRPLLSTGADYDDEASAKKAMDDLIAQFKALTVDDIMKDTPAKPTE